MDNENIAKINDTILKEIEPQLENVTRKIDRSLNGFPLPVKIYEHDDYDERLTDELNRYVKSIEDTPALSSIKGLLDGVKEVVNQILFALKAERRGDTAKARKSIMLILKKFKKDPFFVSEANSNYAFRGVAPFDTLKYEWVDYKEQLTYPLSFFRCRKKKIESQKEMLHVPLSKRSLSSANRFSLPGIPCLYIASTTYCCWKELDEPADMSAIAFRLNKQGKKLKILNLVVSQRLIDGVDFNPYEPMPDLAFKMRILFPLVIATSVSTNRQEKCAYYPEYTISHLIMRCLKELKIDGVAYLSSRIADEFQFPHGVNVAIPIFSESSQQKFGEICKCFEITDPLYFSCKEQRDAKLESDSKSYINAAFSDGFTATVDNSGTRVPYQKTLFGCIDNELTRGPYYCALEE